ncbi:amelotin [Ambystoma mexicanum]|uniref:amelotin n=1 Tax=Ambystoma mexicanum TaxID=8296 RepID=UPI0037E6F9AA
MKATILLLCLLGTSVGFPFRQAERLLSASNSGEMLQLMQLYNMLGNNPEQQQTQQQVHPARGLPPAQLVPDLTVQQPPLQQPSQFQAVDNVFGNIPMIPPFPMQPGIQQSPLNPVFNMMPPMTRFMANAQDLPAGNQPPGFMPYPQVLPMNVGEMTVHQPMFPHPHHLFPIIITQMGQQGMPISSEEMQLVPQIFTGMIMPPFGPAVPGFPVLPGLPALPGLPVLPPLLQGAILPAGQAGASLDEQEAVPMGQAGANANNQGQSASPAAGVTQAQDTQEIVAVTVPAGMRNGVTEVGLQGAGKGGLLQTYTPPAGLKQFPTDSVTDFMFVEPTALATDTSPSSGDGRHQHSFRPHNQRFDSQVRGDHHLPMVSHEGKPLRKHKKRRA